MSTKPYDIPKWVVFKAYQDVKANRGSAGIDGESIERFEQNLSKNLYRIWNRLSSGSYFPPPVKLVEIPKKGGGIRRLGVPTVSDRIAQTVVKTILEQDVECLFHSNSYGYRPGKSAKEAVAITRQRCWTYNWVVEFDIKGAFDNINQELLMKAVRKHTKSKWILLYIERWLKAPFEVNGIRETRSSGTPQGGVISPLLMNLFMHYAFDVWMQKNYPMCPFARYADDAVIHCKTEYQAKELIKRIERRLNQCKLTLHPGKTRVVYCKDSNRRHDYPDIQFTFLGFTFRPRRAKNGKGVIFTSFLPAVSKEAQRRMMGRMRDWNIQRQTPATIEELSKLYNPVLRGWWNYYGSFYKTEMRKVFSHFDRKLAWWVRRKFKKFSRHRRKSVHWLGMVARKQPQLFIHWEVLGKPSAG